jgi:hypothetical protein
MSTQPEALRLADILDKAPVSIIDLKAAAELRRLYAESEMRRLALLDELQKSERLHSVNAELLAALKKRAEVDFTYVQLAATDMDGDTHERLLEEIDEAENSAKELSSAAIARAESNATS